MRKRWVIGVFVALSLVAAACGDDDDDTGDEAAEEGDDNAADNGGATAPGVTADEVRISLVSEQSGSGNATSNGIGFTEGFEAYIEKYNDEEGGVNGRKINLVATHDDQGDANKNAALIQTAFEQDKAFTIVGCFSKFGGIDYINTNKLPMIGCNYDPPTWEKSEYAFGYSGNWLDKTPGDDPPPQPVANVAYTMKKLGKKKLAVFSYDHPGSRAASQDQCKFMKANYGLDCVFEDYTLAFGFTDLGASVQKFKESGADFVYGGMDSAGGLTVVRSLKRAGIDVPSLWAVVPSVEEASASSDLIGNLYSVQTFPPFDGDNPEMKELVATVNARKPGTKMSLPVINGWAEAKLLIAGLEEAGPNLTRDGFYKAIRGMKAFNSGVGATVDFTKSPEEKIRENIQPDPNLCAGFLMRGDEKAKKMIQVGNKPQLCLSGVDTPAELDAVIAKDKSKMTTS